ncbi:MAG: hypothetical protein AAGI71_09470 [Bacteroidota bacterium]
MTCSTCGATAPVGAVACPYCEAALVFDTTIDTRSRDDLFAFVKASDAYARRDDPQHIGLLALQEAGRRAGKADHRQTALFLGAVAVGGIALWQGHWYIAAALVAAWWGYRKLTGAPPIVSEGVAIEEAEAALITAKRTQVNAGAAETSTDYFVTVELEDGTRHELAVLTGIVYGDLAEGDAGVAYLARTKTYLAWFDRVPLPR